MPLALGLERGLRSSLGSASWSWLVLVLVLVVVVLVVVLVGPRLRHGRGVYAGKRSSTQAASSGLAPVGAARRP